MQHEKKTSIRVQQEFAKTDLLKFDKVYKYKIHEQTTT